MQASQEIQNFTRFEQNTHRATVSTSTAAAVLLTLGHKQKEDFQRKKEQQAASGKSERLDLFSDAEKAACREDIQRFFQAALECPLLHETLVPIEKKAAIQALKGSIDQRLTYLLQTTDPISIYIGGEVYLVMIPLQVVLGLVARATLNSEVLDQGKTPEQTKKDQDARVLTLYNACNRWNSNRVCNHGFFNDLVYALDRIWPGIHLIGPVLPFIESIAREFITKRLQDHPNFFVILKAFALGDNSPWERFLQEIKEETNRQVKAGIEKNGLNPDAPDIAKNRSDFFEAFENLDPYWDITQWTRHIEGIGNLKPDDDGGSNREAAIKKAKQILQDCTSFADLEKTHLRQLLAVERAYQLALKVYKKNATTQLKLFAEIIENSLTQARNCFAVFARGELLKDTNIAEFENFFEGISAALSDVPQVESFMALWFNPESDEQGKQSLYKRLSVRNPGLDQAMEKHFTMLLAKRVDRQGQPILDLWDVNSIIFSAIFQSPKNWSDNLNTLVKYSIALVENILAGKAAAGADLVATYPREKMQELIEELRLLVDIYQACKSTKSEGPGLFQRLVVFPIIPNLQEVPQPVLNLIASKINSLDSLKGLPLQFIEQLITPEGWPVLLAATITTVEDLKKLNSFSKDVRAKLVAAMPWSVLAQSLTFDQWLKLGKIPAEVREKLIVTIDAVPDEKWTALAQSLTFDQWLKLGKIPAEVREKLIVTIDAVPDEKWKALAQSLTFDQWLKLEEIPAEVREKLVTAGVPQDKGKALAQLLTFDQWLKLGEIPVKVRAKLVTAGVPQDKGKELAQSLTFDKWLKLGEIPVKVREELIAAVPDEKWTALAQALTFKQWLKLGKIPAKVRTKLVTADVPQDKWKELAQSLTFDQWLKLEEIPAEVQAKLVTADVPQDKWKELAQSLTFDQWLKLEEIPAQVQAKLVTADVPQYKWGELIRSVTFGELLKWHTLPSDIQIQLMAAVRIFSAHFTSQRLDDCRQLPAEIQLVLVRVMNPSETKQNELNLLYVSRLLRRFQLLQDVQLLKDTLFFRNTRSFVSIVLNELALKSFSMTRESEKRAQMVIDSIVESIDYFPRLRHIESLSKQKKGPLIQTILKNQGLIFDSVADTINFGQLQQLMELPAKIRKPLIAVMLRDQSTLDRIAQASTTPDRMSWSDLSKIPKKIRNPLISAARREGKEIYDDLKYDFYGDDFRLGHYHIGKRKSLFRRAVGFVIGIGAILLGGELFLAGALLTATFIGSSIGIPLMAAAAGVMGAGVTAVATAVGVSSAIAIPVTGATTALAGGGIAAAGAGVIVAENHRIIGSTAMFFRKLGRKMVMPAPVKNEKSTRGHSPSMFATTRYAREPGWGEGLPAGIRPRGR